MLSCANSKKEEVKEEADSTSVKSQIYPKLPESVLFCGKTISLDNFDIRERLDKEIIVNTYYHSSTIQSFKRANRYFNRIEAELKDKGVPEDFKYLEIGSWEGNSALFIINNFKVSFFSL